MHQEEQKTVTLRYQRTEAVRRVLAPQGFVGLLAGDLADTDKVITLIDLDHAFFKKLEVTASTAGSFEDISLGTAQLAIDYGGPDALEHEDLVFTSGDQGPKTFTTFINEAKDLSYDGRLELTFLADEEWEADQLSYSFDLPDSTDRHVVISPQEHVQLTRLRIEPGNVDWEVVQSIDVRLVATGYGPDELRHQVTLTKDVTQAVWGLRGVLPAPPARGITASLVQTLTDGSSERTEPAPVEASLLRVDDLFVGALDVVLVPAFDASKVTSVIVDLQYVDAANEYERQIRREVPGTQTEPVRVRIALRDPELRTYKVRYTFTGPGLFDQRAFLDTEEEVLPIQ